MKRNLDLLREILLAVEEYEPARISMLQSISPRDFSGTEAQNFHHINMLADAGYIKLAGKPTLAGDYAVHGMTIAGHDFLDAIKEQSVWDHTKKRVGEVGSWTLDVVLAVAKEEVKRRLGLALNGA
ncbi:MAG: DUF2513 domain-containing protein [Rhodobacteraceae bacterium]|nr:DUF2513 domain-containing protein [Paracoccaceae bacterium]